MSDSGKDSVDCGDFVVARTTSKALLVLDCDEKEFWIPKSQICEESYITPDSVEGDQGALTLPEWLAIEKNFV